MKSIDKIKGALINLERGNAGYLRIQISEFELQQASHWFDEGKLVAQNVLKGESSRFHCCHLLPTLEVCFHMQSLKCIF